MTLRGERVVLRRVTEEDIPALLEILLHPEVRAWWGQQDAARLRREYAAESAENTGFVILDGTEIVGMIGYWEERDPDYRHAGMDIFVAPARHGEGLASDALRTLARHLFEDVGHHRLVIDPAAANENAIRAYEAVGFRRVGVMRMAERSPGGEWHDALLMDMLRDELTG